MFRNDIPRTPLDWAEFYESKGCYQKACHQLKKVIEEQEVQINTLKSKRKNNIVYFPIIQKQPVKKWWRI